MIDDILSKVRKMRGLVNDTVKDVIDASEKLRELMAEAEARRVEVERLRDGLKTIVNFTPGSYEAEMARRSLEWKTTDAERLAILQARYDIDPQLLMLHEQSELLRLQRAEIKRLRAAGGGE